MYTKFISRFNTHRTQLDIDKVLFLKQSEQIPMSKGSDMWIFTSMYVYRRKDTTSVYFRDVLL